jgi:NhaA family Na+:H+ antiporter
VLIAVLYATDLEIGMLALAFVAVVLFAILSRVQTRQRALLTIGLIVLAIATWVLVLLSGVHPTIAGVLLGLAMSQDRALRTRHALEPWINGLVLPLFAFSAALVPLPKGAGLPPVFWAVFVALPVGKLVGIAAGGWIAQRVLGGHRMPIGDLLAAGALGGIGFTVSLLLANLAFATDPALRDGAILGVLAGSLLALVLAGAFVSWRAHHYRVTEETP